MPVYIFGGFLLQWPTILTVLMFPLLVCMYVHLALSEERDAERDFGETYRRYAAVTPRWIPHWGSADAAAHPRTQSTAPSLALAYSVAYASNH